MKLEYSTDEFGKDILLQNNGNQIMMEWEKPYMEACIDKLNPYGRVLEMGFGLGYSATQIQKYENVKEHIIIDCSPVVWRKMNDFLTQYPKAKLEKGRWQDILSELGKFDCIFFDDTMDEITNSLNKNQHDFIKEIFINHTDIGARLVCYSGKHITIDESNISLEIEEYKIKVPSNCKYVNNDILYIPLFTKKKNIIEEDLEDLEDFFKPFSVLTTQKSVDELHFNNKQLLYYTIQTCYRNKNYDKLNKLCTEYLKKNKEEDRQRRMVEFFNGFSNFNSNPITHLNI